MSYSGADDQSEDGELKRSPPNVENIQEELDFSLSDDADTADSLDIKPPQAKLATRTVTRTKYSDRNREAHGHHSRSERHRDAERSHGHRESEKRHRDKHESSRNPREYREKDREYRDKEVYFLKEQYSREAKETRYSDRTITRDRKEEVRYPNEQTREVRYSDSKVPYTEHEKHRKDREIRYTEYDPSSESRRDKREAKYYESLDHLERRERKETSRRDRKETKNHVETAEAEKTAADRALEDLRERLLDKRRTKEHEEHKHSSSKSSRRHKSRRDNLLVEAGEILEDSKTYVKEIIDLSKAEEARTRDVVRPPKREREEDEMTAKDIEERELRREKLLEAEREMSRQKEKYRQEAEARRDRRERKRMHEQQKEDIKRRKLEEENEALGKMKKATALTDEMTGIVTVSDNSEESDIEMEEQSSDHKDGDGDLTERSNRSNESDDSEVSSESRRHDSEKESARSDEFHEQSPMSVGDLAKSDHSEGRNRSQSKSRSPSHERSHSRSRSRSRSFEEDEEEQDKDKSRQNSEEATEDTTDKEPVEELPPYIPAIQGCRSVEEFQCLNRIEEGTYGVVYRARDKRTDEIVALKRLKMEKEKEGFPITSLREINTLLKGQHPNIVTVREIVVGSNMDKIFIVMDYVEHDLKSLMETMRNKKQGFVPGEVKCLLLQLLRAVAHLHDNWILHRDLKTSNLLLSHKGILKVGDFGLAREYGSPLKAYTPIVVTLWYRAPELLLCAKEYSTPIDIWSVGCIFAELLTMNALFPGKSEVDQLNRIFKDLGTPNEKIWPGYSKLPAVQKMTFTEFPISQLRTKFSMLSDLGLNLMTKFLTYDPTQRITADDALKHQYFVETPLPIDPAMFPTWPAKSELGHRKALAASPKPPSGGGQYKKLGDGDDDSALGFHMGTSTTATHHENRRMGGGFSLKF